MPCLNTSILENVPVSLPSMSAQKRIAEILDAAGEAVRSTERLVAKLELARQGLLYDRLIRDSADWIYSDVDSEFDIRAGITLGRHRVAQNHPRPYLRVANVQRDWIDTSDVLSLEASAEEWVEYAIAADDLLIVEGHANPREIGRCAIAEQAHAGLLYQNHLFRLRAQMILPRFAVLWLNSAFAQNYWWRTCATSSGLYTINSRHLKALPVLIPDMADQVRIVELAASASSRLSIEQRRLDKLRLLKQGLLDDLLTGHVRVGA
jgi:type I restriction enzyme S subunit